MDYGLFLTLLFSTGGSRSGGTWPRCPEASSSIKFVDLLRLRVKASSCYFCVSVLMSLCFRDNGFGVDSKPSSFDVDD